MAVNSITTFSITVSGFGNQLTLFYELPEVKPENWKPFIFKRSSGYPTETEIDAYFAHINDLHNYDLQKLYVFESLPTDGPDERYFDDGFVRHGTQYYYAIVLRNMDTGERSAVLQATAKPEPEISIEVPDGKELVAEAIKNLMSVVKNREGRAAKLNRDIEVVKNMNLADDLSFKTGAGFLVERVNGSEFQRYFGDRKNALEEGKEYGSIDVDVIKLTFFTDDPTKRDTMVNILRGYKPAVRNWIKNVSKGMVLDVSINIEGDGYKREIKDRAWIFMETIFSILCDSTLYYPEVKLTEHITDDGEIS
jgi:hypothetical protein